MNMHKTPDKTPQVRIANEMLSVVPCQWSGRGTDEIFSGEN